MAKKRSLIAELIYQQQLVQKQRQRAASEQYRTQQLALKLAEQAERKRVQMQKLQAKNDVLAAAQATYEARLAEEKARDAKIAADNEYATNQLGMIDAILTKSVSGPKFTFRSLKYPASHPEFAPGDLNKPTAPPPLVVVPPEPLYNPPPPLQGISKLFQKRQYEAATAAARAKWNNEMQDWEKYVQQTLPAYNQQLIAQFEAAEHTRKERLAVARAQYDQECSGREVAARRHAQQIDDLNRRVSENDTDAMLDFIGAIVQNSSYPETYFVSFKFEYDANSHEVTISVRVPAPADMWIIKSVKWVRSTGEIRETRCSQAEQRNRYNTAVAAVALRTMSELFRAEPSDIIKTISLTVNTETDDPATGQKKIFRFVEVAADREQFPQYNLEKVEPAHALEHMHAAVSKNAFALKTISGIRGIRG